jgi:hypothetical protein
VKIWGFKGNSGLGTGRRGEIRVVCIWKRRTESDLRFSMLLQGLLSL